ncbi:hypothetical protein RRG08_026612 [Elysia crispata]|uniref:Uncharacterized protein n=1 Tax=Elysia crispata TaxID=231223 RepID=A0AAE1AZ67_9GAST|nr:hypothetical protein RRG08_026612 [Elysia crispata]
MSQIPGCGNHPGLGIMTSTYREGSIQPELTPTLPTVTFANVAWCGCRCVTICVGAWMCCAAQEDQRRRIGHCPGTQSDHQETDDGAPSDRPLHSQMTDDRALVNTS